jgi:hypothetical protein
MWADASRRTALLIATAAGTPQVNLTNLSDYGTLTLTP